MKIAHLPVVNNLKIAKKLVKFPKKISIGGTRLHLKILHPIHTRIFHQLTSTFADIKNSQLLANVNCFTFARI